MLSADRRFNVKQLHAARHAPEAHLVKGFLELNGIAAVVRGRAYSPAAGASCRRTCAASWIDDDSQYERAHALLVTFLNGDLAREYRDHGWRCARCGEQLEGQFTSCWSCGAAKP